LAELKGYHVGEREEDDNLSLTNTRIRLAAMNFLIYSAHLIARFDREKALKREVSRVE